jgi:hypothetical protein
MAPKKSSGDWLVLVAMAAVLIAPFALTLNTVSQPRALEDFHTNPTPRGYTWSLSLFVVPVVVLAIWLARRRENKIQNKAFWLTTAVVAGGGFVLDALLGRTFFTFENQDAVLGIHFYGWSSVDGWQKVLPVEEIFFYLFGALATLLVYIWGDEFWFAAYNVDNTPRKQLRLRQLFSFHIESAIFGVVIFFAGWLWKKFSPHADHEGFPGYFLFLTLVALTPSIVFFPVARPFINWRAFSLGFIFMLLVSLFWEATLAVPYQWWGYRKPQMLGLFINGFCGLPVEAALLWLAITWATIIIYETVLTLLCLDWSKK